MTVFMTALVVTAVLSVFAEFHHQWKLRVTRSDADEPQSDD